MAVFRVDVAAPVGSVDPNTIASSTALGFNAKSVLIDNFTAYWLFLPNAFLYIPPFFIGVIAPLEHVANYGSAIYLNPFAPTVAQNPTDTSYFTHFTWTDVVLPPSPGAPLAGTVPGAPPTNSCCSSGGSTVPIVVQLVSNQAQQISDLTQTAVIFNAPADLTTVPRQFDPNSLRSTTPLTIGGVVTAAGDAVVINTATAGYWEISLQGNISLSPNSPFEGLGQFFIYYENGPNGSDFFPPPTLNLRAASWQSDIPMATFGTNLISGQQLGISCNTQTTGGADAFLNRIVWRLTRLGDTIP